MILSPRCFPIHSAFCGHQVLYRCFWVRKWSKSTFPMNMLDRLTFSGSFPKASGSQKPSFFLPPWTSQAWGPSLWIQAWWFLGVHSEVKPTSKYSSSPEEGLHSLKQSWKWTVAPWKTTFLYQEGVVHFHDRCREGTSVIPNTPSTRAVVPSGMRGRVRVHIPVWGLPIAISTEGREVLDPPKPKDNHPAPTEAG